MKPFKLKLKLFVEKHTPLVIGKQLCKIPYEVKLGPSYAQTREYISCFNSLDFLQRKNEITERFKLTLQKACTLNRFYETFYKERGFEPEKIKQFEDIATVPLTSKKDLQTCGVADRSFHHKGDLLLNTGGTTGQPLCFYVDRNAFARHFAHYHYTWNRLGYRPDLTKLTFRGKNLSKGALHFNSVHNEFYVNASCDYEQICQGINKHLNNISFIHGYPSAIYEFVKYCRDCNPLLLERLRDQIKGIFFDSEFPSPVYRNLIEESLTHNTLACYCHSEMAIMAYEIEKNVYAPHQTYGFCEAVVTDAGTCLVGTSYFNHSSPFIRYNTGDLIKPVKVSDGVLEAFEIDEGRVGEFITDKNGKKISLTAFIFGRHHKIFETVDFVQICQPTPGTANFIITTNKKIQLNSLPYLFDLSNIRMDFHFTIVKDPIRTLAGKVPLLVKYQ